MSSSSLDDKVTLNLIIKMIQIAVNNAIYLIIRLLLDHLMFNHDSVKCRDFSLNLILGIVLFNEFFLTACFVMKTLIYRTYPWSRFCHYTGKSQATIG